MARAPTRSRKLKPAEQARIAEIFERFETAESDPRTELNYASPYELVVAVALSAQATDVSVNKATDRLFKVADTPKAMLAPEKILDCVLSWVCTSSPMTTSQSVLLMLAL